MAKSAAIASGSRVALTRISTTANLFILFIQHHLGSLAFLHLQSSTFNQLE